VIPAPSANFQETIGFQHDLNLDPFTSKHR
jgi:hypothetical protein